MFVEGKVAVTKTPHDLEVLWENLVHLSSKLKALCCWYLHSYFTDFSTAHNRVKMENKSKKTKQNPEPLHTELNSMPGKKLSCH